MYSILIKGGNNSFVFATDETTGDVFTGSLAEAKTKFTGSAKISDFKTYRGTQHHCNKRYEHR